jgi:hypothetical protein
MDFMDRHLAEPKGAKLKRPDIALYALVVAMVVAATPAFSAQTFVSYSPFPAGAGGTLAVANVTGTISKGVPTGSVLITDGLLASNGVPVVGPPNNPNFPLAWYTPTPDVTPGTGAAWVRNVFGPDVTVLTMADTVTNTITYTFAQPVANPRFHILNQDIASIGFVQGLPAAPTSLVKLSGNDQLTVSGTTIPASSTAVNGLAAGCQNGADRPAGICGTVEIPGTYTSLTFLLEVPVPARDNFLFTLSADTELIGGTVTGLDADKSVTLQVVDGASNAQVVVVNANGTFTFPTGQVAGTSYNVTVTGQPAGEICIVTNGAGTVALNTAVTDVLVTCQPSPASPVSTLGSWAMGLMAALITLASVKARRFMRR